MKDYIKELGIMSSGILLIILTIGLIEINYTAFIEAVFDNIYLVPALMCGILPAWMLFLLHSLKNVVLRLKHPFPLVLLSFAYISLILYFVRIRLSLSGAEQLQVNRFDNPEMYSQLKQIIFFTDSMIVIFLSFLFFVFFERLKRKRK